MSTTLPNTDYTDRAATPPTEWPEKRCDDCGGTGWVRCRCGGDDHPNIAEHEIECPTCFHGIVVTRR